jgi:hypothetical protein
MFLAFINTSLHTLWWEHVIFTSDENFFRTIASVDINKIMVVFITCLSMDFSCLYPFFLQFLFFRENSEIQDGCQGHMTTLFTKKIQNCFFSPSYISYLCYASEKSMIKLLNFLHHGFQTQWNFLKKASALWLPYGPALKGLTSMLKIPAAW